MLTTVTSRVRRGQSNVSLGCSHSNLPGAVAASCRRGGKKNRRTDAAPGLNFKPKFQTLRIVYNASITRRIREALIPCRPVE